MGDGSKNAQVFTLVTRKRKFAENVKIKQEFFAKAAKVDNNLLTLVKKDSLEDVDSSSDTSGISSDGSEEKVQVKKKKVCLQKSFFFLVILF